LREREDCDSVRRAGGGEDAEEARHPVPRGAWLLSPYLSLRASVCGSDPPPPARMRVIRSASLREVRIFVSAGGIRWRRPPPLTRCVVVLFSWLDCAGRRGVGADRLPCSLARARENEFILVFFPLFFIFIFSKPTCLGGDELGSEFLRGADHEGWLWWKNGEICGGSLPSNQLCSGLVVGVKLVRTGRPGVISSPQVCALFAWRPTCIGWARFVA